MCFLLLACVFVVSGFSRFLFFEGRRGGRGEGIGMGFLNPGCLVTLLCSCIEERLGDFVRIDVGALWPVQDIVRAARWTRPGPLDACLLFLDLVTTGTQKRVPVPFLQYILILHRRRQCSLPRHLPLAVKRHEQQDVDIYPR